MHKSTASHCDELVLVLGQPPELLARHVSGGVVGSLSLSLARFLSRLVRPACSRLLKRPRRSLRSALVLRVGREAEALEHHRRVLYELRRGREADESVDDSLGSAVGEDAFAGLSVRLNQRLQHGCATGHTRGGTVKSVSQSVGRAGGRAGGRAVRQSVRQSVSQAGRQAGRQSGKQAGRQAGRQANSTEGSHAAIGCHAAVLRLLQSPLCSAAANVPQVLSACFNEALALSDGSCCSCCCCCCFFCEAATVRLRAASATSTPSQCRNSDFRDACFSSTRNLRGCHPESRNTLRASTHGLTVNRRDRAGRVLQHNHAACGLQVAGLRVRLHRPDDSRYAMLPAQHFFVLIIVDHERPKPSQNRHLRRRRSHQERTQRSVHCSAAQRAYLCLRARGLLVCRPLFHLLGEVPARSEGR